MGQVCDFCSSSPVRWVYPCEDFVIVSAAGDALLIGDHGTYGTAEEVPDGVQVLHTLVGSWAACQPCHELIQDGNIDGVTRRCEERYRQIYGERLGVVLDVIDPTFAVMHHAFMAHRTGEPYPKEDE